jgi:NADPH-dependent 2,4-dienoyl-CoA reductase/sulfur reductase-like enzyme
LRRLDESIEIALFDRGPFVSFANCGLPYYVGNVMEDEERLVVASPDLFRRRFNIEVFTNTEVKAIDRQARTIAVTDPVCGAQRTERYDGLVLSPGAAPIRPRLPGVDRPGVFAIRNIPPLRSYCTPKSAISKTSVAFGGIGPLPELPYASSGGMTSRRCPPTFIPATPRCHPAMTPVRGNVAFGLVSNCVPLPSGLLAS